MSDSSGSLLLGLDGITVESAQVDSGDVRIVHVGTAVKCVGICSDCLTRSSRHKGWATTRPRDIKIGADRPLIAWRKLNGAPRAASARR